MEWEPCASRFEEKVVEPSELMGSVVICVPLSVTLMEPEGMPTLFVVMEEYGSTVMLIGVP
jgi:hypothetical protein